MQDGVNDSTEFQQGLLGSATVTPTSEPHYRTETRIPTSKGTAVGDGRDRSISSSPIIDLLGDDQGGGNDSDDTAGLIEAAFSGPRLSKRKFSTEYNDVQPRKTLSAGEASFQARNRHMPEWMQNAKPPPQQPNHISQPATANAIQQLYQPTVRQPQHASISNAQPEYLDVKKGFVATWKNLLPPQMATANPQAPRKFRAYQLSLLNVSEFTISGLATGETQQTTSLAGLRAPIRQISRDHGKAVYERDADAQDGGKWRIPLGAYQAFYSYLVSQPHTMVEGIPSMQLKVASLGKARLEKDFPSRERLIQLGVPERLANTLAPFQRGGVDFVHDKNGRALIADEMGLGKSIQAIASMTMYHKEWPVLVLSPSGARYHWQNEFVNWCGEENYKAKVDFGSDSKPSVPIKSDINEERAQAMPPLKNTEIHVLTSAKDPVIPSRDTKVVVCSYGLAPRLVEEQAILPGLFRCAIVDESHMLKNKSSKRTSLLVPVLRATTRCILLSGTPAFARPMELYPQLSILGTENDQWWLNERDFTRKYVKGGNVHRRAELHTLLTGTIMIRRMKKDILKQMPSKMREQAFVNVCDERTRKVFQECISQLREGRGALAKIAKAHTTVELGDDDLFVAGSKSGKNGSKNGSSNGSAESQVEGEVQERFDNGMRQIQYAVAARQHELDPPTLQEFMFRMQNQLREELRVFRAERIQQLRRQRSRAAAGASSSPDEEGGEEGPRDRKSLLTYMYKKTGEAKLPLVLEMLRLFLLNPAHGKVCIFAHHISVLDALAASPKLVNGEAKYIRIDGSTSPKARQEQINQFQNDPTVRIALLGITAAGVAVTLTASSTVWFTELYWTPALLIQAEDRCHRIGQQARVRCLYLVAKGTLDEILWKHVEKKFRDLGEFVEGKEKMKIVVHKIYKGVTEVKSSLTDFDGDFGSDIDEMEEEDDIAALETELCDDLEEMEREEREKIKALADHEDDDEGESSQRPRPDRGLSGPAPQGNGTAGTTESEAICLSDDDEAEQQISEPQKPKSLAEGGIQMERKFLDMRFYKLQFVGRTYGLEIEVFRGRVVVKGRAKERVEQYGEDSKPRVGDVLLAINRQLIPFNVQFKSLMDFLAAALMKGPVEIIFGEDDEFREFFIGVLEGTNNRVQGRSFQLSQFISKLQTFQYAYDGSSRLNLSSFQGHIVVSGRVEGASPDSVQLTIGDVLMKVGGKSIPSNVKVSAVHEVLRRASSDAPMQLTFVKASPELATYFAHLYASNGAARQGATPSQKDAKPEVIDLLDD